MFGTSGIRGPVGDVVTGDLALDVGRAVATDGAETVVLGRDARESGSFLADAVAAGLQECGATVVDLGTASTPTVARSVDWCDADAGVAVTASHNPPEDNGLKLWTPTGQAFDETRRDRIARRIHEAALEPVGWDAVGRRREWPEAERRHRAALRAAGTDLDGLSVVVDVGNGVGGLTADVLADLGAEVTTLNARPDGRFPGRPSEPTPENCADLVTAVGGSDADLGIAHDGDADRMLAVDGDGSFVGGDDLLALFAAEAVGPGERIAVPVDASRVVDDVVADAGGEVIRTKVGDVYVAEAAAEPDVVFGGEASGAWIWPDETLCPDGHLAACRVAAMAAERPLAERVADLPSYPIERDTVGLDHRDVAPDVMERVEASIRDSFGDVTSIDGVRVAVDDGWFLIRPSGTQPLVRLTAEATDPERSSSLLDRARDEVEAAIEAVDGGQ